MLTGSKIIRTQSKSHSDYFLSNPYLNLHFLIKTLILWQLILRRFSLYINRSTKIVHEDSSLFNSESILRRTIF
jgi:hypothetical protein